jgi:hypothetical protein
MTIADEELYVRTHGKILRCSSCGFEIVGMEDEYSGAQCNRSDGKCRGWYYTIEELEKREAKKKPKETRAQKAKKMYNSGMRAYPAAENMWYVKGSRGDVYSVARLPNNEFSCTCKDFSLRGHECECKHIILTKLCLPAEELVIIPPENETLEVRAEEAVNEAMSFHENRMRKRLTHGIDW